MRQWFALLAVVAGAGALPQGQPAPSSVEGSAPPAEYVAFRVDDQHLIATVLVRESTAGQVTEGLSPRPVAQHGFQHFTIPTWWRDRPFAAPPLGRWLVHLSPASVIEATAEEAVGGYAQCQEAVGVLLRATPEHSKKLAASAARYFVASPSGAVAPARSGQSPIGAIPLPPSSRWQAPVEAALDELLARERPRVRADAAAELSKMESSTVAYHRSFARELRRVETAMARNEGRRQYDVQAFRLGPVDTVYFVRAEWLVQGRQGFAVSLWLRTEPRVEVIETNVRPASWLRAFEFQGRITREHLGLVLNVFDRDADGWGEILFLDGGYESFGISLRRYSATGFVPTDVTYGGGC
jgi:hypothetical protein